MFLPCCIVQFDCLLSKAGFWSTYKNKKIDCQNDNVSHICGLKKSRLVRK
jgi:hypothetical protein